MKINKLNFRDKLKKYPNLLRLFSSALVSHINLKEIRESFDFVKVIKDILKKYQIKRVLEIGCGHGLIGQSLIELNYVDYVYQIDLNNTHSHKRLEGMLKNFTRVFYYKTNFYQFINEIKDWDIDLILGCHLCGNFTDFAIDIALQKKCSLMISPCCYGKLKTKGKEKQFCAIFGKKSIDMFRCSRLIENEYLVRMKYMNNNITPMNKIIIAML